MFKRSRLIGIFTGLLVLFAMQVLAPETFAQCVCAANTVTCTETLDGTDATSSQRPQLTDPESTCAVPQTCPGVSSPGPFIYDLFRFTNNTGGASPDCFTITMNAATCGVNLAAVAYLGNFDPTNACTNYLGDSGVNFSSGSQVWGVNVANGATLTIIVFRSAAGAGCNPGGTYNFTITPCPLSTTATDGQVTGRITDDGGAPLAGTVITLSGTQNRKTITDANGFYSFASVESNGFYTVRPSLASYSFSPIEQSFSQVGNTTSAVFTGSRVSNTNPLDTPEYFVRQHYLDFLGREPDEAGFNFWSDQILGCGADAACIESRRINVSAAYFKSIEFQNTGGFVDGLYRASFGRRPLYAEFIPDIAQVAHNVIVGHSDWQQNLLANKEAFLNAWVERAAFNATFDLMTDSRYVDTLIENTGVDFSASERDALVTGLSVGSLSRADVLQQIAEDQRFVSCEAQRRVRDDGILRLPARRSGCRAASNSGWIN